MIDDVCGEEGCYHQSLPREASRVGIRDVRMTLYVKS